jgi:superfamily II DNA or RNA helicase/HKD family nuclease
VPKRLVTGLYEELVTRELAEALHKLEASELEVERGTVDPAEAHEVVARHLHRVLLSVLRSLPGESSERVSRQVELANRVLGLLQELAHDDGADALIEPAEELLAIAQAQVVAESKGVPRPGIPLSTSALLVNAPGEHRIGHELAQELASADAVDLLCSFVKWSGFRLLEAPLRDLAERGKALRVLTTAYMGVTEGRALDELARLGAQVRVSYDTRRTRLHAKAWLFHRDTGFSTAYIGSSNMTASALLEGLEWNVRLSAIDAPGVVEKFRAAFAGYWAASDFEPYSPESDRERFDLAVRAERAHAHPIVFAVDVRPHPFQAEILDRLDAERKLHGRFKNLVVAATGTGKTVMAAMDYRRVRGELGRGRLLFVAHRKELLQQALATFRAVMRDGNFGELWVDGERPTQSAHVFASVQTLARVELDRLARDAFDVVIVDEFHHAAAPTYQRLLEHLQPRLLLGLTATPERTDGQSVLGWFDGRIAAELRLWDALERGLLCPFQYFGVHDQSDLSGLRFTRGQYEVADLEKLFTGNDARVALVVEALQKKVRDARRMRALGFCVSVAHAEFMARRFSEVGIPACAVSGQSSTEVRETALRRLRDREVNVVFAVDLFNEGVDVPEIDTVLFLRPTESATVFLQQLGRGLRLSEGKECLTVLDFIGRAHRSFRFDLRYRALVGGTRGEVERQIEAGFPVLPAGCAIELDRESSRVVLENLKHAIGRGTKALEAELREVARTVGRTPTLREFLERSGVELTDVYRRRGDSCTGLLRKAGLLVSPVGSDEERLVGAVGGFLHVDDPDRFAFLRLVLAGSVEAAGLGPRERRLLTMLHFGLWGTASTAPQDLTTSLARLRASPTVVEELGALVGLLEDQVDHMTAALPLAEVPIRLHAHYTRDEVLSAFERTTPAEPYFIREGVYFDKPTKTDVLFVTLQKSEKDYSPTTMYRDYAISPQLFHWESQSMTSEDSPTGKRYRDQPRDRTNVLIFVRRLKRNARGQAEPYVCLGLADYVQHVGEKPMAITWRLRVEMPIAIYRGAKIVAA